MCLKPPSIRRWKIGQKLIDYPKCPHPKVLQWGILAYLIRFRPLVLIINGFNRRGSCQKFNLRNPQDPPRLPQIHKVSLAFLPLGFHKVSCRQGYPQRAIVIFFLQMFVYWYMHNFLIYLKKVAGWNQIVCQKLRLSTSQVGSHERNQYPVLIFFGARCLPPPTIFTFHAADEELDCAFATVVAQGIWYCKGIAPGRFVSGDEQVPSLSSSHTWITVRVQSRVLLCLKWIDSTVPGLHSTIQFEYLIQNTLIYHSYREELDRLPQVLASYRSSNLLHLIDRQDRTSELESARSAGHSSAC